MSTNQPTERQDWHECRYDSAAAEIYRRYEKTLALNRYREDEVRQLVSAILRRHFHAQHDRPATATGSVTPEFRAAAEIEAQTPITAAPPAEGPEAELRRAIEIKDKALRSALRFMEPAINAAVTLPGFDWRKHVDVQEILAALSWSPPQDAAISAEKQ